MGATRIANVPRMAATSIIHSSSALGAALRCRARHKGMSVATLVTARELATLVYRMLIWGQNYVDEGQEAYEERNRKRTLSYVKRTAKEFGSVVLRMPVIPEAIPTSPG